MADLSFSGGGGVGGTLNNIAGLLNFALDVNALVNPQKQVSEGRRLSQLQILGARNGAPIPQVFGRMRVGGQLLWTGKLKEHVYESGGDKGGGSRTPTRREYRYSLSFAVGLCGGEVNNIGRIWADGKLLAQSNINYRLHSGGALQEADPTIESAMGVGSTPAYRGLAYIVFQDFDLTLFGNRIPQLSFEIFRPPQIGEQNNNAVVRAVNILPGATEFGYHPEPHIQLLGIARARSENINAAWERSDWDISIDALQASHPQCRDVALVVAWFGDSLQAGECRLQPCVENYEKNTLPTSWNVAGLGRRDAKLVSRIDERPAFGGTPSDASVVAAIRDLRARGFRVLFYPFIMMDIPRDKYPWRGRISSDATTPQKITSDVSHFVNGAGGDDLFCLRGMMRHYAKLCEAAGGVDAFLIGSELKSLSRLRVGRNAYPFAQELVSVAQMVRGIVRPETKISYAADWSEYGAFVPQSGSVEFPLDEFWGNEVCDFIGIDAYFPLADWRDGAEHLDAGAVETTNPDYLRGNMDGGEFYDWYYANAAARDAQTRTPISAPQNEEWLYRAKDIRGWWSNAHRPRENNQRGAPTAWRAQSKPIWFTEVGCPAVDKGANQPNIFPDRVSVEGGLPHYSNGARDDHIQQAYLAAFTEFYAAAENNPTSHIYNDKMVARERQYFWAWDARPFPAFPYRTDIWTDGGNWHTGHWLNGRQAVTPLTNLLGELATSGGESLSPRNISGAIDGYAIASPASVRDALTPLLEAYGLDAASGAGQALRISGRHLRATTEINADDVLANSLTIINNDKAAQITRLDVHYINGDNEYEVAVATARASGADRPMRQVILPLVLSSYVARNIAERLLYEARLENMQTQFHLPPKYIYLEVGDIIYLHAQHWRITRLSWVQHIEVEAVAHNPALYDGLPRQSLPPPTGVEAEIAAPPLLQIMDLPSLPFSRADAGVPLLAATATPFINSVLVLDDAKAWQQNILHPATMGRTLTPLAAAPIGRLDKFNVCEVELYRGVLASYPLLEILGGRNLLAVKTSKGWEVLQFASAELIGERQYRLSGFLRGIKGSEAYMDAPLAAGAEVVLLDDAVAPLAQPPEVLPHHICVSYGVSGLAEDSYAWSQKCFTHTRAGLRPLSPVHIKARKNGDRVALSWVRRSRLGGDDFDAVEIPIGEAAEIYRVRIMNGAQEISRTQTNAPQYIFDAGEFSNATQIRIAQLSATQQASAEAIYNL